MSNNDYNERFILLVKKGEELRSQLSALKNQPISENPSDARAEVLKCERLRQLIDENLKELQFTYYMIKAEDMK